MSEYLFGIGMRSVGVNVAGGLEAVVSFSSSDRFVEVIDSLLQQHSEGVMGSCRNTILYLLSRSAPPGLQEAALGSISHRCVQHIDVVAHIPIVAVAVAVALSRLFWC